MNDTKKKRIEEYLDKHLAFINECYMGVSEDYRDDIHIDLKTLVEDAQKRFRCRFLNTLRPVFRKGKYLYARWEKEGLS